MQVVVKGLCDELLAAQQERDQLRKTNKQVQSKLETISKAHAGAERVCGVAWHISHPLCHGLTCASTYATDTMRQLRAIQGATSSKDADLMERQKRQQQVPRPVLGQV